MQVCLSDLSNKHLTAKIRGPSAVGVWHYHCVRSTTLRAGACRPNNRPRGRMISHIAAMTAAADAGAVKTSTEEQPRVLICGAGVIGSAIAYFLSLRGINPTVVERTGVACAASGKAGGFLAADWADGTPLGPFSARSFQLHEELASKLGDVGYRRVNTLSIKTSDMTSGKVKAKGMSSKDIPHWLDGVVLAARKMADETTTAQVHPEKLTHALLDAAQQHGAQLKIGTVEGISVADGKVTGVKVNGSDLPADVVVLAMGPWTSQAVNWLPSVPRIGGQKAHSIVVKPSGPVSADCLFLDHRNKTGRQADPECYPRPDGTVYICGESESVDPPIDPADIQPRASATTSLQEVGAAISSVLASGELVAEQACFLPLSPDQYPVIGPVPGTHGAYVASGHSCWGILNAPATGEAMAELILDGKTTVDISAFSPVRFGARSSRRQF